MNTKNTFIQNLKDTTTVLQQLRVCIDTIKSFYDNPQFDAKSYVDEKILEVNESINAISQEIDGINDDIDGVKNRVTTLENTHTYCVSVLYKFVDDCVGNTYENYNLILYAFINSNTKPNESDALDMVIEKVQNDDFTLSNVRVYSQEQFQPEFILKSYSHDTQHENVILINFDATDVSGFLPLDGGFDITDYDSINIAEVA